MQERDTRLMRGIRCMAETLKARAELDDLTFIRTPGTPASVEMSVAAGVSDRPRAAALERTDRN